MIRHVDCTFAIEQWDEAPVDGVEGTLKVTHASVARRFIGALEGTSVLHFLMFYGPQEQTRVIGVERFTGTLEGRRGSFVLEHLGGDDGFEARGEARILPHSGTEELASIQGTGVGVANRKGEMTMTLEYEL